MSGREFRVRTLTLLLLTSYMYIVGCTNAQSLKEIKSKIALEIEVEKIKNDIIQKLRNKGAPIGQLDSNHYGRTGPGSRVPDITASRIVADVNAIPAHVPFDKTSRTPGGGGSGGGGVGVIPTPHRVEKNPFPTAGSPVNSGTEPKSKPLIVIGESRSKSKKDKCLNFRFGKYMKTDTIVPIRMNLWIYLRVQRNRKKKKDEQLRGKDPVSSAKSQSHLKNPSQERVKRQTKAKKNRIRKNKKGRKRKRNKKGRKVKIFVSDESKELVILRMRVKKTNWYMLELPISQFPSVINFNYTRTLCIRCKRCNKKIKVDLRSKRLLGDPTVPFIHIEPLQSLPHSIYRHTSRRRRSLERLREPQLVPTPCCREDIHTEFIAKDFPNVLHPLSFNVSMCTHLSRDVAARAPQDSSTTPLLSQQNSSISQHVAKVQPSSRMRCETESMAPLTVTFIDRMLNIQQTTIDHLLPTGCRCRHTME